MKHLKSRIIISIAIAALSLAGGGALGYDLPQLIGTLYWDGPDSQNFARSFCWAGDQNGDGYDDLLVNHDPRYQQRRYVNRVYLYYGGERMDNQPDMVFETDEWVAYGSNVCYLGHLDDTSDKWFAFEGEATRDYNVYARKTYFFRGGEALDTEPDIIMSETIGNEIYIGWNTHDRYPADYNGDDYDDIVAIQRWTETESRLLIYYGGAEFDTIPDWSTVISTEYGMMPGAMFCTGRDVNSDGYDEFLICYYKYNTRLQYSLYLGGDPVDTTTAWTIHQDQFVEEQKFIVARGFNLLPDVNRDGYDDIGLYWYYSEWPVDIDGYLIFFGGEHPDTEYDLDLEGDHALAGYNGVIAGGDFNGDGSGDVVTGLSEGFMWEGEAHIYFGSRWMDRQIDILMNGTRNYGPNRYPIFGRIGAIGDYNGDGIQDFISKSGENEWGYVHVFAGNPEWRVKVNEENPNILFSSEIKIIPNPFNDSAQFILSNMEPGTYRNELININGQLVWHNTAIISNSKNYIMKIRATFLPSGIYILRCINLGSEQSTHKYLLKKAIIIR